jgi:hypothetical protein
MEQQQNAKKICKQCGVEFVEKKFGTFEHKYCSKECRNNYNNTLRNDKFKQLEKQFSHAQEPQPKQDISGNYSTSQTERNNSNIHNKGYSNHSDPFFVNLLERQYDAKVNAMEYRLKCDELERRCTNLEQENITLKLQLEEYEEEEEDTQNNGGWIGQLMENDTVKQALPLLLARAFK